VASIAWYCRVQRIAARTGQLDSNTATCMHTAASIPGATKSRYGTPSPLPPRLTSLPKPIPRALRYRTGLRTLETMLPRHTRRYDISQYS
jgi:hypothetical protein